MAKPIISIDWMQVTCNRNPSQYLCEGMYLKGKMLTEDKKSLLYELKAPKEFNAIFDGHLSVTLHNFVLGSIYFDPKKGVLKPKVCMLKIANPLLYSGNWMWYLIDILSALNWTFQNISRVDLCADFNEFANELQPVEFIRRYMHSGEYSPFLPSYYRVGGNKYATIGYKLPDGYHYNEYLRFGSRSTGVCVYLYNKTRELNEKGGKKYIRNLWAQGGLKDDETNPVFRLELSITPSAMTIKETMPTETKNEIHTANDMAETHLKGWQLRAMALDDLGTQKEIERVFWAYASKYFRFKIIGEQKMPHNWPDLQLFDVDFDTSIKPYKVSRNIDCGVAEKNAANCLSRLLYENMDLNLMERLHIESAISILEQRTHLKTKTITKEQALVISQALKMGKTWDEITRMRIISATQKAELKQIINEKALTELYGYMSDARVLRALDEYDATISQIKEQAKYYETNTTI